jgi:hypothetical protein
MVEGNSWEVRRNSLIYVGLTHHRQTSLADGSQKGDSMQEKLNRIFQIANNAIYFDDSSNYRTALYEVCTEAKSEEVENIGKKYIEEEEK